MPIYLFLISFIFFNSLSKACKIDSMFYKTLLQQPAKERGPMITCLAYFHLLNRFIDFGTAGGELSLGHCSARHPKTIPCHINSMSASGQHLMESESIKHTYLVRLWGYWESHRGGGGVMRLGGVG